MALDSHENKTEYKLSEYYVELYFGDIPNANIRDGLKICGWRWNGKKKCWYNRKDAENIQMAEGICRQFHAADDPIKRLPRYEVEISDLVVRCNSFYCTLQHGVIDVAGVISVIDSKGNWIQKIVPLAYCNDCNAYYILEETYRDLKKWGIIGCQVMTRKDFEKYGHLENDFSAWKEQSPLKLWGYSVAKADGLSDEQRQGLLAQLLDKHCMTKTRMLSYLDFFMRLSINEDSIACWKTDRKFVSDYIVSGTPFVYVKGTR